MSEASVRLGLVGLGKIAHDQHLPAIGGDSRYRLVATADPAASLPDVPSFPDLDAMLAADVALDAVVLCTPPRIRASLARRALAAGLHVMLEKPPAASVLQAQALADGAASAGLTLFAAWHAREAAGVDEARRLLAGRPVAHVEIVWREDVRIWHPGQDWIFDAGGFGVFDPAINGLSVASAILPGRLEVEAATLHFPENREAPIAASLAMRLDGGVPVSAEFDFLHEGTPEWSITVRSDAGLLELTAGGSRLSVDGVAVGTGEDVEYRRLYDRFARLISGKTSDVDLAPLALVADAFMIARIHRAASFVF
ncbi:Gfo/Idh/MocA family protein [Flavisphingomonas formosensis]|uniref:Gfo/Idh/MocA family protein n=1 Tax=Flavisphingomonas formosensis TaxID=861534 RepID=UPI0012FCFA00|nr:Gfo/Idh/MocA family oxidoreductase [Sphingomonas formosensis]